MKLIPVGLEDESVWEDGLWVEKPGYPGIECSWIHVPREGFKLPEFIFEEGHHRNKNDPYPRFCIGSGNDCQIRIDDDTLPPKVCRLSKEGKLWMLEALRTGPTLGHRALDVGVHVPLKDGDVFSLKAESRILSYKIHFREEDNAYIDGATEKSFPNKYPARFPCRSSLHDAPPAPEELRRLAWQTDQMRRRSEEDQVRVADWSNFSQYVKRHYYKHGITCVSWAEEGRGKPIDKKPPSLPARPLPAWICSLLTRERQLPGLERRPMAFASALTASGVEVSKPLTPSATDQKAQEQTQDERSATQVVETDVYENPHLKMSFNEWLKVMDDSLFLLQYHDQIASNFDSLAQIHEIYVEDGEINKAFFEDVGIKKLGHRRIFEKWFREFAR